MPSDGLGSNPECHLPYIELVVLKQLNSFLWSFVIVEMFDEFKVFIHMALRNMVHRHFQCES